ncbi:ABC transporter substrate-binding protein [Gloeothece verrucosa]|uniref:ABC transporter substrate-binding protein n=1 Tax=Gloeothece verrucosa TaxID=2546359 RepID=UPI0009FE9AB5|nr:ABC transporter substrate-binding protein [Gloeothece verrucosa]
MLQGVADAQDEFNNERRKNQNHSLLEIVIANDSNEGLLAKNVAKKLADDISILGIIGHHVSESSQVALDIYKKVNLPVVSSTSSSSKLKSDNFFRTVSSTQKASDLYFKYVTQVLKLKLKDVAIFYTQGSAYSKSIGDTFIKAFNEDPQKVKTFTLGSIYESESLLNIKNTIEEIIGKKYKAVLLLSSAKTNSGTIAFAKENNKLPTARLQLLGSMALAEAATLRKGGKDIEGMILASPCVNQESAYMKEAAKRWQEEVYWRVATSYDAAQALIEAIRLSKEPTRQEIFNKLQNLTLPPAKTSGLGLQWSKEDLNYNTNSQRPYCLFKIENNKFIEIPSE